MRKLSIREIKQFAQSHKVKGRVETGTQLYLNL